MCVGFNLFINANILTSSTSSWYEQWYKFLSMNTLHTTGTQTHSSAQVCVRLHSHDILNSRDEQDNQEPLTLRLHGQLGVLLTFTLHFLTHTHTHLVRLHTSAARNSFHRE